MMQEEFETRVLNAVAGWSEDEVCQAFGFSRPTNLRVNALYRTAESLLDQSPGVPEYVRALANIVSASEGLDGDEVLAALTAFNNSQE